MSTLIRSRWAAIGAATAVTLGLAGVGTVQLVDAQLSSGERSVFVPLTPVRILDTRNGIGGFTGAIAAGGTIELQVVGNGGVPADATGVVMNVTAAGATEPSYVTVWPAGEPRPTASNLNLTPGEDVPNLVTVKLGDGGRLGFFNFTGSTHLIADVAGYYVDHNHDDRYYTRADVDSLVAARSTVTRASFNDPTNVVLTAAFVSQLDLQSNGSPPIVLAQPARIIATATAEITAGNSQTTSLDATCQLRLRSGTSAPSAVMGVPLTAQMSPGNLETTGNNGSETVIALTGATPTAVPAGNYDIDVECLDNNATGNVRYARGSLTVTAVNDG